MEEKRKDPKEKKCAICGKDIYAGEEWAYKRREKSERTKWFCSYKCMRAYDAKHGPKQTRPAGLPAELDAAAPKEPVSRAVVAKALEKEIKRGGSVIAYLKAEGYKNPYQAYDAIRHYCETKMPELAEVLKPLRDLPKGPQKKTGRPRKQPAEVETVEKVPDIEQMEEQVAEMLNLQGGVNYQLKVEEDMKAEKDMPETPFGMPTAEELAQEIMTRDQVLRIVDEAAMECMDGRKDIIWGSNDTIEQTLFRGAKENAVKVGVMKMRSEIRRRLGVEE